MTTTCPICTMVKGEDNVICEDCNTKGLIEHGIQILKNQEDAELLHKLDGYDTRKAFTEFGRNKAIIERLKKRIEEIKIDIEESEKNLRNVTVGFKEFEYRHISVLQEKIRELQKILEGEKPQRITSTKEGRKFLGDFEATA